MAGTNLTSESRLKQCILDVSLLLKGPGSTMKRKLVLYSDQVIPENRNVDVQLLQLLQKEQPVIGYIPSSSDPTKEWFHSRKAYYRKYNLELSLFFALDEEYEQGKLRQLLACDAIHLSGGNTYHFLASLRRRSLIQPLQQYVNHGGVLIGVSAGAILTTPTIHTAALCGDSPDATMTNLTGLHLVSFGFLPHSNTLPNLPTVIQQYIRDYERPLVVSADGSGVIIDGDTMTFIGDARMYRPEYC